MELTEVSFEGLSAIRHKIWLGQYEKFEHYNVKIIAYDGVYRYGSEGRPDARYIMTTALAAHKAWFTPATVIDFTKLSYKWGDDMMGIGNAITTDVEACPYPLAIVTGPDCEKALRSLFMIGYEKLFFESLDRALAALEPAAAEHRRCRLEWDE